MFFKLCCCCSNCCDCCRQPIDHFDNFSYRGITEAPQLQGTLTYKIFNRGRQGIILYNLSRRTPNKGFEVGWKFHIAIDFHDIEKAWDLIKDIIIRENLIQTKLIAKEYLKQMTEEELGREITLYAFKEEDDMNWRPIIQEIENVLYTAEISPSRPCSAGQSIPGCRYFTYRCDQKPIPMQFNYLSEREFYTSKSISSRLMYIDIREAQLTARERGSQPYNPYDFAVPDFITRLINRVEELAVT